LWQHAVWHAATIPNCYSEINVTFYSVTLARTIRLPDDGPRTETSRSVFNVLLCKFYICAVVGIIIEWLDNIDGVKTKIKKNAWCVFLTYYYYYYYYYYSCGQINDDKTGGHVACKGEDWSTYRNFVLKSDWRRLLGRPNKWRADTVNMHLVYIRWEA